MIASKIARSEKKRKIKGSTARSESQTRVPRSLTLFLVGDKPHSYKFEAAFELDRFKTLGSFFSISFVQYPTTVGEVDKNPGDPFFNGKSNDRIDYESLGINFGPKLSFGAYDYNLTIFGKVGINYFVVEMDDPEREDEFKTLKEGASYNYGYGAYIVVEHVGIVAEVYHVDQEFFHKTIFLGIVLSF